MNTSIFFDFFLIVFVNLIIYECGQISLEICPFQTEWKTLMEKHSRGAPHLPSHGCPASAKEEIGKARAGVGINCHCNAIFVHA